MKASLTFEIIFKNSGSRNMMMVMTVMRMTAVWLVNFVGAACHGFSNFSFTVMATHFSDVRLVNVSCTKV